MMAENFYFHLPDGFCVELVGKDAVAVLNNLCTNDIVKLPLGESCEAFITNLRGWVVAHTIALKQTGRLLLLGQHPTPQSICGHIDRYIIREDAQVLDRTSETGLLLVNQSQVCRKAAETLAADWAPAPILKQGNLLCVAHDRLKTLEDMLAESGYRRAEPAEFEWNRIRSFWPRAGREITEKTLPQELDRDASAISFTKGCYLGQETIARLDARGQLQKKLCLLQVVHGADHMQAGETVKQGDRSVGEITSIASGDAGAFALAFLKRGFFEPGTELECSAGEVLVVSPRAEI